MSEEKNGLADAEEFKDRLMTQICNGTEEGQKIADYLDNIVPNWWTMSATRLYKHIQKMLDKADEIRRFEIELVWKRGIYIISLMAILSTAFGYLFINIYVTDTVGKVSSNIYIANMFDDFSNIEEKKNFLSRMLVLIAFANAFLSFCLTIINRESRRWQRNWEYHVDYLQTILGFNLMRVTTMSKRKFFTISTINHYIGFIMFLAWYFAATAIWLAGAKLFYPLSELPNVSTVKLNPPFNQRIWSIFESISVFDILIIGFILFLAYLFLISLISKSILKYSESMHRSMYIRNLEEFRFYKEQPESNNHSKLLHSVITRFLNRLP